MKIYNTAALLILILIMIVVSGCARSNEDLAIPSSATSAPATNTMMFTPSPTITQTPVFTPTYVPTLPVEQAKVRLLELLSNNANCRLPCILGITPGKSSYTEARDIFLPFSSISISMKVSDDTSPNSVWLTYDEGNSRTFTQLSYLYPSNGIISRILFKAGEYKDTVEARSPIYDSQVFGERLRPYMLSGILSEFGKPALVVVHTSGKQITGSGGFEILLLYPDDGIFVRYTTQMETLGTNARGCPANAQVELNLYPSGDADAYAKSLSELSLGDMFDGLELVDNPSWRSIDKATSMSLDQFYETFRQPTNKCIETPLKGWYVPKN
jgi:hypothetical protein